MGRREVRAAILGGAVVLAAAAAAALLRVAPVPGGAGLPGEPGPPPAASVPAATPTEAPLRGRIVLDYAGKYAGLPEFEEKVVGIESLLPGQVRFVRDRLGLGGERAEPHFLLRLRDLGEASSGAYMSASWTLHRGERRPLLVVLTEDLVAGAYDVEKALRHEIVHAWQEEALGAGLYAALPEWATEGLAEWATGGGDGYLRIACRHEDYWPGDGPLSLVQPRLKSGAHKFPDYARSYLAFDFLERRYGRETVQWIARRLLRSADAAGAVEQATGLSFGRFEDLSADFARDRIYEISADLEHYGKAARLLREDRPEDAVAALRSFLEVRPDSCYALLAKRDLAAASFRLGRYGDLERILGEIRADEADRKVLEEAEYYAVRMLFQEGRMPEARSRGRRFLRDFVRAPATRRADVEGIVQRAGGR